MASNPPYVPGSIRPATGTSLQLRRGRRAEFGVWWREIDRVLLALVLTLMAIGTVAVAAASPASARRLSTAAVKLDDLHFFVLHVRWQILGLITMIGASFLPKDLARRAGMSSRNLARHFHAVAGTTPLRWLHAQRVRRAQELLETTDDGVDLIADRTGMGTAATLRRHFHRALGVSPDAYRRTFRASALPS